MRLRPLKEALLAVQLVRSLRDLYWAYHRVYRELRQTTPRGPLTAIPAAAYRALRLLKEDREGRRNAMFDRQTLAVMRRVLVQTSNCVDVGCAEGSILKEMLALAPKGRHHAFEPIPVLAARLRTSFPTVRVFEAALSDVPGEATFEHVVTNPAYSGLRRRRYPSTNEDVQTIRVDTKRLDDILPEDLRIHFMKIDVEGAELQVLRGARQTIARHRPFIIFEHGLGAADYYGTLPEDVYDLLVGDCGLRISLMSHWLDGKPPLDRRMFVRQIRRRQNYYFLAHS
jgi:FkbM family methyltransferase